MHRGWHHIGYLRDLKPGINACEIAGRALIAVRRDAEVEVYDAVCPHRGASLANGTLEGTSVVCAFHGLRIALGGTSELSVKRYTTLVAGGLVFVREPDGVDAGFAEVMAELAKTHVITPGFVRTIETRPELIIENAFDERHFRPVHGVLTDPVFTAQSANGAFAVSGSFDLPAGPWQPEHAAVPFVATCYSPGIVLSHLFGGRPYAMLTSANAVASGCEVRLAVALPREAQHDRDGLRYLIDQASAGLKKDEVIWRTIPPDAPFRPVPGDESVSAFREFCERFAPIA